MEERIVEGMELLSWCFERMCAMDLGGGGGNTKGSGG